MICKPKEQIPCSFFCSVVQQEWLHDYPEQRPGLCGSCHVSPLPIVVSMCSIVQLMTGDDARTRPTRSHCIPSRNGRCWQRIRTVARCYIWSKVHVGGTRVASFTKYSWWNSWDPPAQVLATFSIVYGVPSGAPIEFTEQLFNEARSYSGG